MLSKRHWTSNKSINIVCSVTVPSHWTWKSDFNAEKIALQSRCLTRTSDNSKYFFWSHRLRVNEFQLYMYVSGQRYIQMHLPFLATEFEM